MKYSKSIFLLICILSFFPSVSFASGSVTFTNPPSVSFQNTLTGVNATFQGSITMVNAIPDDYFLGVKVFQGSVPPTQDQIDNSEGLSFISTNANGTSFNTSSSLSASTSYQFVFKIVSNNPSVSGDVVVVPVITPNNGTSNGEGEEPPCEGCALDNSIITGSYVGWPENVLENTLEVDDINSFVVGLLNALLKIGIPILAVFLVYSGLKLVMAQGNEKELADAKKNLLWVIIGGAVLLGSWTIVKILKGTFDEIDLVFINSLVNFIV